MQEQTNQHGTFTWNELITTDVKGAKEFYGKLLDWKLEDINSGGMNYTLVKVQNREIGGMMTTPTNAPGMPSMWGGYVAVDDVDSMADKVWELGGKIVVAPRDIPNVGRFCVLQDPQGAMLTLITHFPQA